MIMQLLIVLFLSWIPTLDHTYSYQYDAFGRLIRKHLPLLQSDYQTEDHYYDGVRRIQTVGYRYEDPNGPSFGFGGTFGAGEGELGEVGTQSPPVETNWTEREYVYGPDYVDEFVCEFAPSAATGQADDVLYFLQDANYNVVALTDATGAIVEQRVFEPYGELAAGETFGEHGVSRVGHQGLFFERTGGDVDDPPIAPGALGFYYNRNRMYSPTLGRFMQRDPNETALPIVTALSSNGQAMDLLLDGFSPTGLFGDGMNLYQYLGSNPINGRDPSGLEGSYVELVFATGEEAAIGAALAEGAAGAMGFLQAMAGQFLANSLMMSLQIMAIEFSMSNQSGAFDMSVWTAMSDEFTRFLQAAGGDPNRFEGFRNGLNNFNNGYNPWDDFDQIKHVYNKIQDWPGWDPAWRKSHDVVRNVKNQPLLRALRNEMPGKWVKVMRHLENEKFEVHFFRHSSGKVTLPKVVLKG